VDARTALLPVLFMAAACGNTSQQSGNAAQDASSDGTLGEEAAEEGGSDDAGDDDGPGDSPPPSRCTIVGWSDFTGSQPCQQTVTERCDDGNEYTIECSCPAATCSCVRGSRDAGRTVGATPYDACPTCADASAAALFAGCGVPY
jgi:hypothetical protein